MARLKVAELYATLNMDRASFGNQVNRAKQDLLSLDKTMVATTKGIVSSAGLIGIALRGMTIAGTGYILQLGMSAVESESLFTVSMGKMADSARKWSQDLSNSLGLNEYALRKQVGTLNVMLGSMGFAEQASYDLSRSLVELAYDMSSFYDLPVEEAFNKIRSGLVNQSEPLRQLGIDITGVGNGLTGTAKTLAIVNAIMKQTVAAQGDLARTAESPANMLKRSQEELKETLTRLGVEAIPLLSGFLKDVVNPAVGGISAMVAAFSQLPGPLKTTILLTTGLLGATILLTPAVMMAANAYKGLRKAIDDAGKSMKTFIVTEQMETMSESIRSLAQASRYAEASKMADDLADVVEASTKASGGILALGKNFLVAFRPFLTGGVILSGLWAVYKLITSLIEKTRIAGIAIVDLNNLDDAQKKLKMLEQTRKALQEDLKAEERRLKNGDIYNTPTLIGITAMQPVSKDQRKDTIAGIKNRLKDLDKDIAATREKISNISNPPDKLPDGGGNSLSDIMSKYYKDIQMAEWSAKEFGETEGLLQRKLDITRNTMVQLAESGKLNTKEYGKLRTTYSDLKVQLDEYNKSLEFSNLCQEALDSITKNNNITFKELGYQLEDIDTKARALGWTAEDVATQKISAVTQAIEQMIDSVNYDTAELQKMIDLLKKLKTQLEELKSQGNSYTLGFREGIIESAEATNNLYEMGKKTAQDVTEVFSGVGDALVKELTRARDETSTFEEDVINSMKQWGAQILADYTNLLMKMMVEFLAKKALGMFNLGGFGGGGFSPSPVGDFPTTSNFGGYAANGGPVVAGKTYIVGERGPEVLTMGSTSGYITPNHELGGGPINIKFDVKNATGQDISVKQDGEPKFDFGEAVVSVIIDRASRNVAGFGDFIRGGMSY